MTLYKMNETSSLASGFFMTIIHLSCSLFVKDVSGDLTHELHCQNWNATITTKKDSTLKLVGATFQPFPDYEKCFTYYFVILHLLKPKHFNCNLADGVGIKHQKLEQNNQKWQKSYELNFTGLEAGYYCILFQPWSGNKFEKMISSNVVRIEEKQTVSSKQNFMKESTSNSAADIAYICVILSFTLICSIILYRNYKHRKVRKIQGSIVIENGETLPCLEPSDIEVFVFYFPSKISKRRVDCLEDFLKKCAEFNVSVIDDRNPLIHVKPKSYLEATLQCCNTIEEKCTCNKRFIIVMTEDAIKDMNLNRKAAIIDKSHFLPSCSADDDDMQAHWFRYALDVILNNWSKCFKDYIHFFVVYFDDTLYYEDEIKIAPGVRFSIQRQDQVIKLCQELNYSFNDESRKQKLMNDFDNHPIKAHCSDLK